MGGADLSSEEGSEKSFKGMGGIYKNVIKTCTAGGLHKNNLLGFE